MIEWVSVWVIEKEREEERDKERSGEREEYREVKRGKWAGWSITTAHTSPQPNTVAHSPRANFIAWQPVLTYLGFVVWGGGDLHLTQHVNHSSLWKLGLCGLLPLNIQLIMHNQSCASGKRGCNSLLFRASHESYMLRKNGRWLNKLGHGSA